MASDLPESTLDPLLILLVEDDDQLRKTLRELLQEEGYRVVAVPSGTDAVEECRERKFDLIVTDIKTPGSDGLTALEQAKEGNPEVAGIVITGYSTEEYALRAARLKVENYLKKPFQLDDFLLTVERLAERKRREQKGLRTQETVQMVIKRLLLFGCQKHTQRELPRLEEFANRAASSAPLTGLDAREQLALECLSIIELFETEVLPWRQESYSVFPPRIQQALKQTGPTSLRSHLANCAQRFLHGEELADSTPAVDDDSGYLPGSLLNMALLLESTERFEEAKAAFQNVLEQSEDPLKRYSAHFGLSRVARTQREFEAFSSHLQEAVREAEKLGPYTHCQALTEGGIQLALCGQEKASAALEQAVETARDLKDSSSFALATLALEFFFQRPAPNRGKLLAFLNRPEQFGVAVESSGWLLEYLLSLSESGSEERRFLTKLVRSCPKTFEELLLHTPKNQVLLNGLAHLDILQKESRERVTRRLHGLDQPELIARLNERRSQAKGTIQTTSTLRVFSFSGIRLYRDDELLEVNRKKPLLLFLYLLYRDSPVGEDTLCELFWPGPLNKGMASLRTAVSYLRKLLSHEQLNDPFSRQASGIGLSDQMNVWFDFREFQRFIKKGKAQVSSNADRAMDCYRSAVKLYQGPFLENIYEDWALDVREQAELAFENCLRFLAQESLAAGNWAECLEHSGRGLRRGPLDQPFCEMTMRALIELGRHHEAIQTFEQCQAVLERELDLEPSIDMIRLREMARLNV